MDQNKRSAAVPFILVTLLLDTLGIGVIVPVLPRLIGSFSTAISASRGVQPLRDAAGVEALREDAPTSPARVGHRPSSERPGLRHGRA